MYGIFCDLMYKVPARALQESVGDRVSIFSTVPKLSTRAPAVAILQDEKSLIDFDFKKALIGSFFCGRVCRSRRLSFLQAIEFVQQVEYERSAGPVQVEVSDESQSALRPYQ